LSIPTEAEIVCVEKIDDVPIQDRMLQQLSSFEFKAQPIIPDMPFIDCDSRGNRRGKGMGHKSPYKYHR